jgi:hypothetical protein
MKQNPTIVDMPYLVRALLLLLSLCGLLYLTGLVSGVFQWNLLQRIYAHEGVPLSEARMNDSFYHTVLRLKYTLYLVTGIVWMFWLYRSYQALQEVGSRTTDHSPGFAAGCWFIPFLNLVRPFQIIRELWMRSEAENQESYIRTEEGPGILHYWWAGWLVMVLFGRLLTSGPMDGGASSTARLETVTTMVLVHDLVSLVTTILAIIIVYRIAGFQTEWKFEPPMERATEGIAA